MEERVYYGVNGHRSASEDRKLALNYLRHVKAGELAEVPTIQDEKIAKELAHAPQLVVQAGGNLETLDRIYRGLASAKTERGHALYPLFAEVIAGLDTERNRPKPFTLASLMEEKIPPARWAIPTLLSEGLSILGGKPKQGKSWMVLGFAFAIASGGVALGKIQVEQGEVLYLALEDNKRRLQGRSGVLLSQMKDTPQSLYFVTDWPRADQGGLEQVEYWLGEHPRTRLIIIDTWAKFAPRPKARGQATPYDEAYAALTPLKDIADAHNIAILIVMHMRKMASTDIIDEIAGSVGVTGVVDGILGLKRERGQFDARLFVIGRDIVDDPEYALTFDKELAIWTLQGSYEEFALTKERQAILDVLKTHGELKKQDIAEMLGNKNVWTTANLLKAMCKDGVITLSGIKYSAHVPS